jgi:hypothetical protein
MKGIIKEKDRQGIIKAIFTCQPCGSTISNEGTAYAAPIYGDAYRRLLI